MNCLQFISRKIIFFISSLTLFVVLSVSQTQAADINYVYGQNPPPGLEGCGDPCPAPSICWNSEAPGVTDCGSACPAAGGDPWTKYENKGCFGDPAVEGRCTVYYAKLQQVCSTGDKCTDSHPLLNSGRCDCSVGGIYKTCCSNSGGVAGNSCVEYAVDDTNPPWEGMCPAGSYETFCGYGGYPACGAAACGTSYPYPTPDYTYPTPAGPTCTGRYDVTCCDGSTDSLTCPDKTIWDDAGLTEDDWKAEACKDKGGHGISCTPPPPPGCTFSGCGGGSCSEGQRYVSGSCSFDWFTGNGCYADSSCVVYTSPPVPPPPPAPDTEEPTCTSFRLNGKTSETVDQGADVTITAQIADNVRVAAIELYIGSTGTKIAPTFVNSTSEKDYGVAHGFSTKDLAPGTYTMAANASDDSSSSPDMHGMDGICRADLIVRPKALCPTAPTNLRPTGAVPMCSSGSVILDWDGVSGAENYDIRVNGILVATVAHPTSSRSINVEPLNEYNYSITARNSDSRCSPQTASGSFNTACTLGGIYGVVYNDCDEDKIRDGGETNFSNSGTVCLDPNGSGPPCTGRPQSSLSGGSYSFSGTTMPGGNHGVYLETPADHRITTPQRVESTQDAAGNYKPYIINYGVYNATTCIPYAYPSPDGGPGPTPVGCSIKINGNSGTGTYTTTNGNTLTIEATNPSPPFRIDIDGPDSSSYGPFSSTSQTVTWYTGGGWDAGSYTISNGCTTRNVTLNSISCTKDFGEFDINVYTFFDPNFVPEDWPAHKWDSKSYPNTCYQGVGEDDGGDDGSLPTQTTLAQVMVKGEVLQTTSTRCWNDGECNDTNACTTEQCGGAKLTAGCGFECDDGDGGKYWCCWLPTQGYCSYSKQKYATLCGTTPQGGNMYCGGAPHSRDGNGICNSPALNSLCKTNKDCEDGNACTTPTCQGYTPPDTERDEDGNPTSHPEYLGQCKYPGKPYGTICSTTVSGGNMYCGLQYNNNDGLCHDSGVPGIGASPVTLCKTSNDCSDGNACTIDTCEGYSPERQERDEDGNPYTSQEVLGSCKIQNAPPTTICQKDANNNPTKICSTGTGPWIPKTSPGYVVSTCSVNYVQCSAGNTDNASCCGKTNIQGNTCNGNCSGSHGDTHSQPSLGGIVVRATNERCGFEHVVVTDANGRARFPSLTFALGDKKNYEKLKYEVRADVPTGYRFTRGVLDSITRDFQTTSPRDAQGPFGAPVFRGVDSNLYDCDPNCNVRDLYVNFGFQQPNAAWIQTTGGDVHSNTKINTPGGP